MRRALLVVLVAAAASLALTAQRPVRGELLVAAAASLSGLAPELTAAFRNAAGVDVRFNFAGSNTLARQILEGARLDVFISADEAQMDAVERAGLVVAGSRVNVTSNQLAVVVPRSSRLAVNTAEDVGHAGVRRLAMGDPGAVPAGVYGRRWLESARVWTRVESKVIPLPSSPAVLAAIRAGRADAGIVYVSDAHGRDDVRVAYVVPAEQAPRIVYPAAAIVGARAALAREFVEFLRGAAAQRIFQAAGFRPLAPR